MTSPENLSEKQNPKKNSNEAKPYVPAKNGVHANEEENEKNKADDNLDKALKNLGGDSEMQKNQELTEKELNLRNAIKNYDDYGVRECFEILEKNNILKNALSILVLKGINEETLKSRLIGIRGVAFTVGEDAYSFNIVGSKLNSNVTLRFKDYNEFLVNGLGGKLENINITKEDQELINNLKKISAKDLLETGDGKLFEYIHDNFETVSPEAIEVFKSKIEELYPYYKGEDLIIN